MSITERVTRGRTVTYNLSRDSVDWDEAMHWSHYNGAFAALHSVLLAGGTVTEEVVQAYEDIFEDWGIDPSDYIDA